MAWQVLSIQPREITGFDLLIMADNQTDKALELDGQILLNGIDSGTSLMYGTIPAGTSIIREVLVHNDLFTETSLKVTDASIYWMGHMLSRHVLQGYGIHTTAFSLLGPTASPFNWHCGPLPRKIASTSCSLRRMQMDRAIPCQLFPSCLIVQNNRQTKTAFPEPSH